MGDRVGWGFLMVNVNVSDAFSFRKLVCCNELYILDDMEEGLCIGLAF